MNRYWCSFFFTGEDYRPLMFPPPAGILGYWSSGIRCSDDATTLCIWVEAESEEKARELIASEGAWPESKDAEWRFFQKATTAPCGRFQPSEWNKHYWPEDEIFEAALAETNRRHGGALKKLAEFDKEGG